MVCASPKHYTPVRARVKPEHVHCMFLNIKKFISNGVFYKKIFMKKCTLRHFFPIQKNTPKCNSVWNIGICNSGSFTGGTEKLGGNFEIWLNIKERNIHLISVTMLGHAEAITHTVNYHTLNTGVFSSSLTLSRTDLGGGFFTATSSSSSSSAFILPIISSAYLSAIARNCRSRSISFLVLGILQSIKQQTTDTIFKHTKNIFRAKYIS